MKSGEVVTETWAEWEARHCRAQPSKYSNARCEMDKDHPAEADGRIFHAGRTRGGYWKFWYTEAPDGR